MTTTNHSLSSVTASFLFRVADYAPTEKSEINLARLVAPRELHQLDLLFARDLYHFIFHFESVALLEALDGDLGLDSTLSPLIYIIDIVNRVQNVVH